jgi:ubiquitin thioesterase protein OTUB1
MFYEELVELIDYIDSDTNNEATMKSQLHDKLNEENSTSDYCTWYLRVLTAAQMKSDPDRFLPFLLAEESSSGLLSMDIPTFCSREVEPMNKECGMVQVAALAECFGVRVKIEYMDGRIVEDEGGKRMEITLLYRPGHYDILY